MGSVSTLSAGEQQRVALARALMVCQQSSTHTILLLDEVSSNLDLKVAEQILTSLLRLSNTTFVLTSHSPQTLRHCQRIAVLKDSSIHRIGTYEDLLDDPYCCRLIS